jgi:phosphoglycolate phosphatase
VLRPPSIRLAVFDFDGTLADSGAWFRANLNDVADRFGFRRVAEEELEALRHMTTRQILRELKVRFWRLPAIARHMRALAARDAAAIRPFDGLPALLEALEGAGIGIAVLSSNSEANVRAVLGPGASARIGLFECEASLLGKARKLRRLLKRAGVKPEEAIAIGDETRDIEAARKAGLKAAAVGWGYAAPAAFHRARPDYFFSDPGEIAALLTPGQRDALAASHSSAAR